MVEFGADLVGVGVAGARARDEAEVVQDVQGALPGIAGRVSR
jgi:hypothetical protein